MTTQTKDAKTIARALSIHRTEEREQAQDAGRALWDGRGTIGREAVQAGDIVRLSTGSQAIVTAKGKGASIKGAIINVKGEAIMGVVQDIERENITAVTAWAVPERTEEAQAEEPKAEEAQAEPERAITDDERADEAQAEEEDEEEDEEEAGRGMARQLAAARVRYEHCRTKLGKKSMRCGDEVSVALSALDHVQACDLLDLLLGDARGTALTRYAHLNNGQIRMNSGNRIRNLVKKGEASIEGIEDTIACMKDGTAYA
jgi:nitric oxide reductase activation protein